MADGIPDGISREDVEQAIVDFRAGTTHPFLDSTTYDLLHAGGRYPPKAILGLAARRLAGRTLAPQEFRGGEGTRCFQVLRSLGFEIVPKGEKLSDMFATFPTEERSPEKFVEGATRLVAVNAYERNSQARAACVAHYGSICVVCGFDFQKSYGEIGEGFIHVHHLRDLAGIGTEYEVDPIADLRPVCPNCHAMLHVESPAMSIETLKAIMETAGSAFGAP